MDSEFEQLTNVVRKKINECPWGSEQTLEKHVEELVDEIKEVKKALEKNDNVNLNEEIGDVFYDSLFLVMLAEKENGANRDEIIKKVKEKIQRRSPWLFGDVKVSSKEEALKIWNEIKRKEKETGLR
jgi:tetrapyrrole methylase family protein/MazG family protein